MRVAVVGAGVTGLVAARRLAHQGHACDVYERWPGLGGQVATIDVGGGVLLERYYHHLFPTDAAVEGLYRDLGMPDAIEWLPSSVGMLVGGEVHAFTTPMDLLRFSPLPLRSRLRMGAAVLDLQLRARDVEPFESITAHRWIRKRMGDPAWEKVWGPLLRGKFGSSAEELSMAWLWSKLTLRRRLDGSGARGEVLGYPEGGWQPLVEKLREEIEERGGRVMIDRPVAMLERRQGRLAVSAGKPGSFRRGHDPSEFETEGTWTPYDAVVATVPGEIFSGMLSSSLKRELGERYLALATGVTYHTALCLLLELDRDFGNFYWTNVADPEIEFLGLIEQTNFVDPRLYGGRRFLYVANYLEEGDRLLGLGPDELIDRYLPGLLAVRSDFKRSWILNRWLFREPAAQPIVTTNYREKIPPMQTPVPDLLLANTTQIYPEDRGTNYSVILGEGVASTVAGVGLRV